jgi:cation diffusion facilitator CzcD-associated flavoprotein CzcO
VKGSASDVHIHLYSLSTDLNPDWSHSIALQPAIQEYWLRLAHKYDLYSNIVFNRKVLSAEWNMRTQKYDILTEERDGTTIPLSAAILVSATGLLQIPKFPDIPGMSHFRGESFHSARWDTSVTLSGKRVAVIGSGPSA